MRTPLDGSPIPRSARNANQQIVPNTAFWRARSPMYRRRFLQPNVVFGRAWAGPGAENVSSSAV